MLIMEFDGLRPFLADAVSMAGAVSGFYGLKPVLMLRRKALRLYY